MNMLDDKIISRTWRAAIDLQNNYHLEAAKDIARGCKTIDELTETLQRLK